MSKTKRQVQHIEWIQDVTSNLAVKGFHGFKVYCSALKQSKGTLPLTKNLNYSKAGKVLVEMREHLKCFLLTTNNSKATYSELVQV